MVKEKQLTHMKTGHIQYDRMQKYLKSHLLNNHQASLLFSLKSKSTREFRPHFPYYIDQQCVLGCPELDTPEYLIELMFIKNFSIVVFPLRPPQPSLIKFFF